MTNNHPTSTFILSDAIEALRISEERINNELFHNSYMPTEQTISMLQSTLVIIMSLTSRYEESNFTDDEVDLVHRVTTLASDLTNEIFTGGEM